MRQKQAFVLVSTDQGPMIVNRYDVKMVDETTGFGVGFSLLETGSYEKNESEAVRKLLTLRQRHFGDGVEVIDVGANIGVHTVSWAKHMLGWGSILAIEPQAPIYYALCGNLVLNNCYNAHALHAACGAASGVMQIPQPDYATWGSFGSLELRQTEETENIGQFIDYQHNLTPVRVVHIDSLNYPRLDLLKIDVENMELDVIAGAVETIRRCKPMLAVETLKSVETQVIEFFRSHGYVWFPFGLSLLAVHQDDPSHQLIHWEGQVNA